jgi:hypothetical protein
VSEYISELSRAIKATHGCDALHVMTVPVKEVFQGQTAWEGAVEVFNILGHPKAQRCYAWGYPNDDGKGWMVTAVLAIPPVTSPQMAVKAALVAHAQQAASRRSGKT